MQRAWNMPHNCQGFIPAVPSICHLAGPSSPPPSAPPPSAIPTGLLQNHDVVRSKPPP